jgi:cytochrome P450
MTRSTGPLARLSSEYSPCYSRAVESTKAGFGPLPDDWRRRHFDPNAPELAPRMYETLASLRGECPVARSDVYDGFWVVTKYEDVLATAQDWQTYSSAHGLTVPTAPIAIRDLPVEVDPPVQRVYKRLITPFFTPRAVAAYEEPTRDLVNGLIDAFIESGSCEFMDEFARPFPSLAFFDIPHRCAGSNLARLNLRIGLEESLRRLHDIRLADGADIHFHSTTTRSPLALPITFTPGSRQTSLRTDFAAAEWGIMGGWT